MQVTVFFQDNTPGGLKCLMTEPPKIRIRETGNGIDIGLWRRGEKNAAKLLSASYGNRVERV